MTMKIGVLGSGHVGQALSKGLHALGHEVRIGSRAGGKLAEFSAASGVTEGSFADVARFADVVVLAVKGTVAEALVQELGAALDGKVVLDTTNPISDAPPKDGIVQYFTGPNDSLLERLQAAAPKARVVKWFNSVGAHLMVSPKLAVTPSMFICGNDADAKGVAGDLAKALGWNVEDVGTAAAGHAIEALCQLWCAPGFLRNDWMHAYAVLRP
jgi:predicted dinucleotide-binding enzyme